MQRDKFTTIVEDTLNHCHETLTVKNKEYGITSVFHNFERAVGRNGLDSREQVLASFKLKHDISVEDMIDNPRLAKDKAYIDEKIGDSINYLLLLKGMLYENLEKREIEDFLS